MAKSLILRVGSKVLPIRVGGESPPASEFMLTDEGYMLRTTYPRVVCDSTHLATVVDRMYGANARAPYSTWFSGMVTAHGSWTPSSGDVPLYLLTAALIYRATEDSTYKNRFLNNIPASTVPQLEELWAWDLMWDEVSDELKIQFMQRVADGGEDALFYQSVNASNRTPTDASQWFFSYYGGGRMARGLAYAGLFAHTDFENNKDPEAFPFNANNFVAVVAYQLSDDGYFHKINSRFGGDPAYNDALPGSYGGVYDCFGYDIEGNGSNALLYQSYKTLTGVERHSVLDSARGTFYQNMAYPYKGTHLGRPYLMDTLRMRTTHRSATNWISFVQNSPLFASFYQDARMQWFNQDDALLYAGSNYARAAYWLLFYDDTLIPEPHSTNPSAMYFNGPGIVTMRTEWEDTAAVGVFLAGEGISRRYEDGNSFILGRNVDVVVHAGYRAGEPPLINGTVSQRHWWYVQRSISKNTIQIYDPDECRDYNWTGGTGLTGALHSGTALTANENFGGQQFKSDVNLSMAGWEANFPLGVRETSNITKFEHDATDGYTYTVGDATDGYTKKIDLFEREFVFIRPDIFIVFDRVNSVNSSFKKVWRIHTSDEPVISGTPDATSLGMKSYNNASETVITNAGNVTYLTTLLPAVNKIVIRGGEATIIDAQPLNSTTPITGTEIAVSDLDVPRFLEVNVSGTDTSGSLVIAGDTETTVGTTETIAFTGAARKFSVNRWERITGITTSDMDCIVSVYTLHYHDCENAAGTVVGFVPPTSDSSYYSYRADSGMWNLSVEATVAALFNNFLNVFCLKDPLDAQPAVSLITNEVGGGAASVALIDTNFVLFGNAGTDLTGTSITLPAGTYTGLICNLTASTAYWWKITGLVFEIADTNNGGTQVTSSSMGLIRITGITATE